MNSAAQIAYEGYRAFTNGKTFDGRPMPTWEELETLPHGRRTIGAWEAAVAALDMARAAEAFPLSVSPEVAGGSTCPRRIGELGPWEHRPGLDRWRENGTCSFCGSLDPTVFMQSAEVGTELTPTDKDYKVYINPGMRKFYFQHLDTAQRDRFVELLNTGTLKLAVPGRFYVLPFFVAPKAAANI